MIEKVKENIRACLPSEQAQALALSEAFCLLYYFV